MTFCHYRDIEILNASGWVEDDVNTTDHTFCGAQQPYFDLKLLNTTVHEWHKKHQNSHLNQLPCRL